VKWGRQPPRRAEQRAISIFFDDQHAKAALERRAVSDAQTLHEGAVGGAAAQKNVLAVVNLLARLLVHKGVGAAAEERTPLHQGDFEACVQERQRRGEPRQPAADDYAAARRGNSAIVRAHTLNANNSFSREDRLTLP